MRVDIRCDWVCNGSFSDHSNQSEIKFWSKLSIWVFSKMFSRPKFIIEKKFIDERIRGLHF